MTGVIDDGNVGIARIVGEVAQGSAQLANPEVMLCRDDVEACVLEHLGHGVGVPCRIGKRRDLLIGGVADHERNALFRKRWLAQEPDRRDCQDGG